VTSVQFLGSGDAFGSGGRLQTCILVRDGEWRCLIDCGTSVLIGLKGAGIDPASIDAIVISHLHGDHFGGLPFFLLDAQFNSRRSTPLIIAAHRDLDQRLPAAMEVLFPGSTRAIDVVPTQLVALDPAAPATIGPARVEAYDVEHECGSPPFAIRLTTPSGHVVGYSGDTEWTDTLVEAADGCDLFVAEAYFHDKRVKWHLDYSTLRRERPRLRARRLIATHPSADLLARSDALEIDLAHDGLVVEL
jgi:ribonuclease BN (tRNA processing enzyme)